MSLLFVVLMAGFTVFCLFSFVRVLLTPAADWFEAEYLEEDLRALQALENHRDKLVQQLRDLELDYTMNKVSKEDYETYKARFESQAVTIAKKIDQRLGGKGWQGRADVLVQSCAEKCRLEAASTTGSTRGDE